MINQEEISNIIQKIVNSCNPEKIILFGSYAIGSQNENSDLDLLVVNESDLPRPLRTAVIRKELKGTNFPIDLVVYTPTEIDNLKKDKYCFIYEVLKNGKTLYERGN